MNRPAKGTRILIAEDFEVIRRGIRSVIEGRPQWTVCGEARTGAETIEKTKSLGPDLLLLDVTMPDMRASEIIPQVLQHCPAVKIVALAMEDSAELAAQALAAGADGLVLKSEPASDLLQAMKNVAGDQYFLSPAAITMIRGQLARPPAPRPLPTDLSPREFEVFASLARGRSSKELAATLGISLKTVSAHRSNIMRKLGLRSYSALIQFAIQHGIVEIPRP
jgi:DNA-binding NarL/FixJ family response regulator